VSDIQSRISAGEREKKKTCAMKEGMKIQWIYSLYADTLGELD
jgi:hypothetical protein